MGVLVLHGTLDNSESAAHIHFILLALDIYSVFYVTRSCDLI